MPTEELKKILDNHKKWTTGKADGSRADLRGANLRGANLCEADLCGADLSGAKQKIIHVKGSRQAIYAIDNDIRIGCKRMPLVEWLEKYREIAKQENYTEAEACEYGAYLRCIQEVLCLPKN